MPDLYKNEYYNRTGQWTFYSLETKPIYAIIFDEDGQFIKKLDTQEIVIELDQVRNAGNDLHFVRSEKIESYYYVYIADEVHSHSLYVDGNFIYRTNKDDIIDKMVWISTQPPLTYEMQETILQIMSQGACRRYEMVDLIYWHLRACNRIRLGNESR